MWLGARHKRPYKLARFGYVICFTAVSFPEAKNASF